MVSFDAERVVQDKKGRGQIVFKVKKGRIAPDRKEWPDRHRRDVVRRSLRLIMRLVHLEAGRYPN